MENIASSMMEVSLNPTTSTDQKKEEAVPVIPSELASLIDSAKVGDSKILLKTAEAVNKFLLKQEDRTVALLMDQKGFLQFLRKCFPTSGTDAFQLETSAARILTQIIIHGRDSDVKAVVATDGLIASLVKLIGVQEKGVSEQVTLPIVSLATNVAARDKLLSLAPTFLEPLANLVASNKSHSLFLKDISHLFRGMIIRETFKEIISLEPAPKRPSYFVYADILCDRMKLTSNEMASFIDIIGILINFAAEEETKVQALHCLAVLVCTSPDLNIFLQSDLSEKIVPFLNHSDEKVVTAVLVIMGKIAKSGTANLVKFLYQMKKTGSGFLREYYKVFNMDLEKSRQLLESVNDTLNGVVGLVSGPSVTLAQIQALIQSGFLYALVRCLKEKECSMRYHALATEVIKMIATNLPPKYRTDLLADKENLEILLEMFKSPHDFIIHNALSVALQLIQSNPDCRDKLISHDIVSILLNLFQVEGTTFDIKKRVVTILGGFAALQWRPKPALEHFKQIPGVLVPLLGFSHHVPQMEELALLCIDLLTTLANYGQPGINLVLEVGDILNKLVNCLNSSGTPSIYQAIMFLVYSLSKGTRENRRAIVEAGILEQFEGVLKLGNLKTKRLVYATLLNFRDGDLPASQKAAVQQLIALSQAEMAKGAAAGAEEQEVSVSILQELAENAMFSNSRFF